jgi:hypothetical protein
MPKCNRCLGMGYDEYEEDGRQIHEACYHCGNTGEISEEEYFHDCLGFIAGGMAYKTVLERKRAMNEDPEGEGFDFCAAENMMTSFDYFEMLVYDYTAPYYNALLNLSKDIQKEYVRKYLNNEYIEPLNWNQINN